MQTISKSVTKVAPGLVGVYVEGGGVIKYCENGISVTLNGQGKAKKY